MFSLPLHGDNLLSRTQWTDFNETQCRYLWRILDLNQFIKSESWEQLRFRDILLKILLFVLENASFKPAGDPQDVGSNVPKQQTVEQVWFWYYIYSYSGFLSPMSCMVAAFESDQDQFVFIHEVKCNAVSSEKDQEHLK